MAFTRKEWSCVVGIAIAAHVVSVVGYARAHWFGAEGKGIGGVEIGLGELRKGSDLMEALDPPPTENRPPPPNTVVAVPEPTAPTQPMLEFDVPMQFEAERLLPPSLEPINPSFDFDSDNWLRVESNYLTNRSIGTGTTAKFGGTRGLRVRYVDLLRAKLNRHKQYPAAAQREAIEGTATLFLHVKKDGSILEAFIQDSSGSELLDAEVLRMVERAEPMPKFKMEETRETMKLLIPIEFSIVEDR